MEKEHKIIKWLPLLFSALAIISLLGEILVIKTKVGDTTNYIKIHLWNLFDFSISIPAFGIVLISLIVLSGFICIFRVVFKNKNEVISIIMTISFLVCFCLLAAYPEIHKLCVGSNIQNYKTTSIGYGSGLAMLFCVLGSITSLTSSNIKFGSNVKTICEDGILIALAFILNFIKIPVGPSGSINLQMIPLFIIALRHGPLHGFVCGGIIYGFLTCLTDGYGFVTYPFDYLIGFGSVAIIGLFQKQILSDKATQRVGFAILACLLATIVRFIGGTVSSIIVYQYAFVAALTYNAIYIPVSGAVACIVLILLLPVIKRLNLRYDENN